MSRSRPIALVCPSCGMQFQAELWDSVNITVDPDLRGLLLRRELNVVHCVTCAAHVVLPAPLLYHDGTLRFAVQYLPAEALADPRQRFRFTPDGMVDCPPSITQQYAGFAYLLAPHVVFSIDEMIRYIEFREALAELHGEV